MSVGSDEKTCNQHLRVDAHHKHDELRDGGIHTVIQRKRYRR